MAVIRNKITVEMYPTPQDVCEVISAVSTFHPGQELKFLEAIQTAVTKRIDQIKESEQNGKHA